MRHWAVLLSGMLSAACSPGQPQATAAAPLIAPFADRIWLATSTDSAPRAVMIFLSNGALMMTSCVETYRLARWTLEGDVIRWREDTAMISARYRMKNADELWLHVNELDQQYVPAEVPYVCPDLPR